MVPNDAPSVGVHLYGLLQLFYVRVLPVYRRLHYVDLLTQQRQHLSQLLDL